MRFVEVKSQVQSDIQALHRARERLVSERIALINPLRACCWSVGSWRRRAGANWKSSFRSQELDPWRARRAALPG
jgi:hypothetical protein